MANPIVDAEADLSTILNRLDDCEAFLATTEPMFEWEGKRLEEVIKLRSLFAYRAGKLLFMMKSLEDFVEIKHNEAESVHWKRYNEKHGRALTTRDIQAYIAGEPDIVALRTLISQIAYQKRQLEMVYDILKSASYDLKNITELRVHEIQDTVLLH
jgi:hypothetical protein